MQRLFVFVLGDGVGDDAGADVEGDLIVFLHGGADGDVPLAAAVEAEPADGAGVEAAGVGFEFGDDFAGAFCLDQSSGISTGITLLPWRR